MNLKDIERTVKQLLPLAQFMDVEILAAQDGEYRCKVPLNEQTKNHFNTIHAALLWAGAELLGGLIWIQNHPSQQYHFVMKEMNIRFLKPAKGDVIASAQFTNAQVDNLLTALQAEGRYDFELEAEVRDEQGELLAQTTGHYAIRPLRTA